MVHNKCTACLYSFNFWVPLCCFVARAHVACLVQAAFASVSVWLFPAPVEMTSELSKELKSEDLSEVGVCGL